MLANDTFVQDDLWQQYRSSNNASQPIIDIHDAFFSDLSGPPQRLENEECLKAYGQALQTTWGDVALIYQYQGPNLSGVYEVGSVPSGGGISSYLDSTYVGIGNPDSPGYLNTGDDPAPFSWICPDQTDRHIYASAPPCMSELPRIIANADSWAPLSGPVVDYCLGKPMREACEIDFSLPIAIIVILLNAFKAIIMVLTVFTMKEQPLITIWDAVASFLKENDTVSKDMCLMSRKDFEKKRICPVLQPQPSLARRWMAEKTLWFRAASTSRWASVISLYGHVP